MNLFVTPAADDDALIINLNTRAKQGREAVSFRGVFSTSNRYSRDTYSSYQKARESASGTPQTILKVTGYGRDSGHFAAHLRYITRNGELPAFDQDNQAIITFGDVLNKAEEWHVTEGMRTQQQPYNADRNNPEAQGRRARESVKIVLSSPAKTDPESLREAAVQFASETFPDHDFVTALHTDTANPHVHLVVRMRSSIDGSKLRIGKKELYQMREAYAQYLARHNIKTVAASRRDRGIVDHSSERTYHIAGRREPLEIDKRTYKRALADIKHKKTDPTPSEMAALVASLNQYRSLSHDHQSVLHDVHAESGDTVLSSYLDTLRVPLSARQKAIKLIQFNRAKSAGKIPKNHRLPIKQPTIKMVMTALAVGEATGTKFALKKAFSYKQTAEFIAAQSKRTTVRMQSLIERIEQNTGLQAPGPVRVDRKQAAEWIRNHSDLPTSAMLRAASNASAALNLSIPEQTLQSKKALGQWLSQHRNRPSPGLVNLARKIARERGERLPPEAIASRQSLSAYVNENNQASHETAQPSARTHNSRKLQERIGVSSIGSDVPDDRYASVYGRVRPRAADDSDARLSKLAERSAAKDAEQER